MFPAKFMQDEPQFQEDWLRLFSLHLYMKKLLILTAILILSFPPMYPTTDCRKWPKGCPVGTAD